MMVKIATARAYERKAELGGGFRGVAVRLADKKRLQGEIRDTLSDAREEAKSLVFTLIDRRYVAPGYGPWSPTNWYCNYFADR